MNDNDNDINNDNEPIISREDSLFDSVFDNSSVINVNKILAKIMQIKEDEIHSIAIEFIIVVLKDQQIIQYQYQYQFGVIQ